MHGIVRILMDLPELTGIEREIAVGPLADRARGVRGQSGGGRAGRVAGRGTRALRPRAARLRGRDRPRGDLGSRRRSAAGAAPGRGVQGMRTSEDFQALAVLFKRVKNIAKELADVPALDRDALTEPAERALLEALDAKRPAIDAAAAAARTIPVRSPRSPRCVRPSIVSSPKYSSWPTTSA